MMQGQIVGLNGGKVDLYSDSMLGEGSKLIDSANLLGQFFSFKRLNSEPKSYFLSIDSIFGQFHFVWDNDLFILLNASDLNQSLIEKSPTNEILKSFSDTISTVYERRLKLVRQTIAQAQHDNNASKIQQAHESYFATTKEYKHAISLFVKLHKQEWASMFILTYYHKELGRQLTLNLLSIVNLSFQKSQMAIQLENTINGFNYPITP